MQNLNIPFDGPLIEGAITNLMAEKNSKRIIAFTLLDQNLKDIGAFIKTSTILKFNYFDIRPSIKFIYGNIKEANVFENDR